MLIGQCSPFTLGPEVSSQAHRDGTGNQLSQTAIYNDFRVTQSRQTCGQGEGDGQAIGEADDHI